DHGPHQYVILRGSFLACSTQRVTSFSDGRKRTSLRFLLASAMDLASLAGLRYCNSFTVSTPTSHRSPAYSLPMPLIRSLSAMLAQRSSLRSSSAVLAARSLRPLGLFAASSSFSVVRMPTDLSA